jgi:hypothetical protein
VLNLELELELELELTLDGGCRTNAFVVDRERRPVLPD